MMNSGPSLSSAGSGIAAQAERETLGAMSVLSMLANPEAVQAKLDALAKAEAHANDALAAAQAKITELGDLEAKATKLASWEAAVSHRENIWAERVARCEAAQRQLELDRAEMMQMYEELGGLINSHEQNTTSFVNTLQSFSTPAAAA